MLLNTSFGLVKLKEIELKATEFSSGILHN